MSFGPIDFTSFNKPILKIPSAGTWYRANENVLPSGETAGLNGPCISQQTNEFLGSASEVIVRIPSEKSMIYSPFGAF